MKTDFRKAKLSPRHRQMLEFVEKLTRTPWLLEESDLDSLRKAGFSDLEVLHIVLGTAHFNYLNRVADGVGIRLEYEVTLPTAPSPRRFAMEEAPRSQPPPSAGKNGGCAWIDDFADNGRGDAGEPRNFFRAMGGNPEARKLARAWRAYQLRGTSRLDAGQRSWIAFSISSFDRCAYTAHWHQKELKQRTEEPLAQLDGVEISRRALLLRHARKLAREPATVAEKDLARLREAGLDDLAILELTMLVGYLSFESRVALGLGVSLESTE